MRSRAAAARNRGNRTLEIASLLGREFPLALLQTAAGATGTIESLFERGVLVEGKRPGQGRFAQPSEARKVAAGIPWSRRRDYFAAVAAAAKRLRFPPDQIATFFEHAQQTRQARDCWVKAAGKACRQGAYASALKHLDRALAIWPWNESPAERVSALRELARCALNGGRPEPARRAWEELADYAADAGQHALHVEALRQLAEVGGDAARISDCLKQAADIAERELSPGEAVRQLLIYVDNLANRVRLPIASAALDRAVRIAERIRDPALLSEVRGWQGLLAAMCGNHERAAGLVEESLRIAVENELAEQSALAYRRRANIHDYGGRYAEEQRAHAAAIEFCRRTKAGGELVCLGCLSYACFRTGDWQQALRSARAVTRDAAAPPTLKALAACTVGLVHAFRGERGPALRHLKASVEHFAIEGFVGMEFFALWGLAWLRHTDGDADGAVELFDQIRALWRETDDLHDVVPALLFAGGVYGDAGLQDRLADCLDILGKVLRKNPLGEARAALAALHAEQARLEGRGDDCRAGWADAAERYAALALPVERLWAESRRVLHDARSTPPVSTQEAVALAKRLGMRPFLAILQRGERGSDAPGDLTRRQRDVLQFLARGLTSKEIADQLGLSTRTVEMHVGRLLQRLNCRTRPEAVRAAINRGWLRSE